MRTALAFATSGVLVSLAAAYTGSAAAAGPRTGGFAADLAAVNAGGSGHVQLEQTGTNLVVDLTAVGLDDGIHVAHIHGVKQAQAECPGLVADTDGNGLVDIGEGLPFYGPVVRTLSNGTNDRGTSLAYQRTFKQLDNGDGIASLGPLDDYAVVVHGVDIDGNGQATNPDALGDGAGNADNEISMPALCGAIVRH